MAKKITKPAAKKKAAPIKKAAPKKAVAKKSTPKKNTPKKAVANKTPIKKAPAKKAVAKKATVKKVSPIKKAANKKAVAPAVVVKKAAAKKKPVVASKKSTPVTPANSLPSPAALSAETAEKTRHTEQVVNQEGDVNNGLNAGERTEDPLRSFDKHQFQKASSKRDPKSKLHLSSIPKGSVKPSGKKPLWNK